MKKRDCAQLMMMGQLTDKGLMNFFNKEENRSHIALKASDDL